VGIGKALASAWDEYERTGIISSACAGKVADAIFGGSLILVLTIVLTVIDFVSILISPFSIGITAVAGVIQPIIVVALSSGAAEGSMIDGLLDVGTSLSGVWDIIVPYLGITGGVLALISGLLATKAFCVAVNNFWGVAGGVPTAGIVMVGAMIGMILACCSFMVEKYWQNPIAQAVVAVLGLISSTFAAFLGVLLFGSALSVGLLSKVSAVISWVGLLVSIGATVNAFQQLE